MHPSPDRLHPLVSPGPSIEHLEENTAAASLELDDEDVRVLDGLGAAVAEEA